MAIRTLLLSWLVRLMSSTWRVRWTDQGPLEEALKTGPVIFACLHGDLLLVAGTHRAWSPTVMVSLSQDGSLLAGVLGHLGYGVLRGGSSKGGAAVLRGAVRQVEEGRSLLITVDGPRGPAGEPKAGALSLSRLSGAPVFWVRGRAERCWRAGSWDSFVVPWFFPRVHMQCGRLAGTADEDGEERRQRLARVLA